MEVVHARNVAIAHVVFEFLAVFTCLTNGWCIGVSVLAMTSSSLVACCFKQRTAYSCWSFIGLFLVSLHALSGLGELKSHVGSVVAGVMQLFLCAVSLVVLIVGCKAASATGGRALLERRQAGVAMQVSNQITQGVPLAHVDSHA